MVLKKYRSSQFLLFWVFVGFWVTMGTSSLYAASKYSEQSHSKESKKTKKNEEKRRDNNSNYPATLTSEISTSFKDADDSYKRGNWSEAMSRFDWFLKRYTYNPLSDAALYRLADIAGRQKKPDQADDYLLQLIKKTPDPEWRERARFLLGRSYFERSYYQDAYTVFLELQPAFLEGWQRVHYYSLLIRLEQKRNTPDNLYPYYYKYLSEAYQQAGNNLPGTIPNWIVSQQESADFVSKWAGHMEPVKKYGEKGAEVGVILPLSGPYSEFGQAMLRGVRCGVGDEPKCGPHRDLSLVVRDTQGNSEMTSQAFKMFADDKNIHVVLGPMSSKATQDLLPIVKNEDNLAVIGLSQGKLTDRPSNFFHAVLTPESQVKRLLDRIVLKGWKQIGILYPDNAYGNDMTKAFEQELAAHGLKASSKQAYQADGSNVVEAIRQLRLNTSYASEDNPAGFQALFIPDSQRRVTKLLRYLANQNMNGVALIGTNAWNEAPFPKGFEDNFPNSFFSDVFFSEDPRAATSAFVKQFYAAYGHNPNALEAIGYDLGRLTDQVMKSGGEKNRKAFKKDLVGTSDYQGATTIRGFDNKGEILGNIYLITQRNGKWVALP